MKKYNYAEARREIINSGIRLGAGDFIDVSALEVAATALEKLSKQPAMKEHERIFFALCYNLRETHKPRAVVNLLADTIPHKRCWYYLEKWHRLGFYSSGVASDLGWFYPDKLPQRYREIVQEETVQPGHVVFDGAKIVEAVYHTAGAAIEDLRARSMEILRQQDAEYRWPTVEITAVDLSDLGEKTESGLYEED